MILFILYMLYINATSSIEMMFVLCQCYMLYINDICVIRRRNDSALYRCYIVAGSVITRSSYEKWLDRWPSTSTRSSNCIRLARVYVHTSNHRNHSSTSLLNLHSIYWYFGMRFWCIIYISTYLALRRNKRWNCIICALCATEWVDGIKKGVVHQILLE